MKITFLGTSHGYAEKNQFQSSTLIEVNGISYIIDAGAPIEYQFVNLGKDFNSIRNIFITHAHLDHTGCLPSIITPFLRFRYNENCKVFLPDEKMKDALCSWMEFNTVIPEKLFSTVKFDTVKEGLILDDGNIKVTAIRTRHMSGEIHNSFGYILDDGEKKVLLTGDIGYDFNDYENVTKGKYDLVICEMAHGKLSDVWEMMARTNTKKMLINHYYKPQIEGYEQIFRKFPFDIQLTSDNMEVIV